MTETGLNTITKVVGGKLINFQNQGIDTRISSISIDSRTLVDPASTLFFAIVGERHDGHAFLEELYSKGVRSFVVSREENNLSNYPRANFILVSDTLFALQQLASWIRKKYQYPVLAITGSNGKTIVKEWLFELLVDRKIIRSPKSFNSQVGVPLSVLNMDEDYDLAIFEAGISKLGEMEKLAGIISPDIGVFTNIGDAHQENFNDKEQKILEKLKLFENCSSLIYHEDSVLIDQLVHRKFDRTSTKLYSWSFKNESAKLYFDLNQNNGQTSFRFWHENRQWQVIIPFTDGASVENAAHCLAFVIAQNELTETVVSQFATLQPVAMRLELKDGINNCTLINDYYNSDINSLEIALQFLNQQTNSKQKKTVIFSDIRQSGMTEKRLAVEVDRLLRLNGIDRFFAIGNGLKKYRDIFEIGTTFYESTADFLMALKTDDFKNESILIKGARDFHFERIASALQKKYHQTSLEIKLNEMVENLNGFRALLKPHTKVMVMVKAFSYGSGTVEIARMLQFQKVDYLAVAVADEGIELRQAGIDTPILVMNPEDHSFETMIEFRLEPNIYSEEVFDRFEKTARKLAVQNYPVHLKIDTGMHRLGFDNKLELERVSSQIAKSEVIRLKTMFSHLAASDDPDYDTFTREQYQRFEELGRIVSRKLSYNVEKHLLNSAGIERFPDFQMDMVRLGIGLYGVSASSKVKCLPIARWLTSVSQVRTVSSGETVGYNRMGKVNGVREIAVIPVGYADGYERRLGNGVACVWVNGNEAPIIGNICMDMSMVDVTGLGVKSGDAVELMGEHISLNMLAQWAGTIPYEILTGISQRVKRVYIQE